MIYIIDEDINQIKSFVMEIHLKGHDNKQLTDADQALEQITSLNKNDILLVDVMLATNPHINQSSFARDETRDFMLTGLILLRKMFQKYPEFPRKRAILFSQASSKTILEEIYRFTQETGCSFLSKNTYNNISEFGNAIDKIINGGKSSELELRS